MKITQALDEKVIKLMMPGFEPAKEVLKESGLQFLAFLDSSETEQSFQEQEKFAHEFLKPYLDYLKIDVMMGYIKYKDENFYNSLVANFKKNKEKTEVDIKEIEKRFPVIKELNQALSVYKTDSVR